MEASGTYSETDLNKVRKGMNRKRKRKMRNSDQWVPVRKKSKRKAGKAAKKNNLVKEEAEVEEEIVSVAEPEEAMEEPSDSKLASIKSVKSCTVRIEKIGS